jgi:hypothetical protein
VDEEHLHGVLFLKCNLGMLITLMDDFADNPQLRNKKLLEKLYRVPFDDEFIDYELCSAEERKICALALKLRANIKSIIQSLPGFGPYYDVFKFDFEQILRANQYSELITDLPEIINPEECSQYGPYNMGMVLAGMIDLMSCPSVVDPLGVLRQTFIIGQRHARLSNVITTLNRERAENDQTNEIVALSNYYGTTVDTQRREAESEMTELIEQLKRLEIRQFDLSRYIGGLRELHSLHVSMSGAI